MAEATRRLLLAAILIDPGRIDDRRAAVIILTLPLAKGAGRDDRAIARILAVIGIAFDDLLLAGGLGTGLERLPDHYRAAPGIGPHAKHALA